MKGETVVALAFATFVAAIIGMIIWGTVEANRLEHQCQARGGTYTYHHKVATCEGTPG